jgi:hypothetical protein
VVGLNHVVVATTNTTNYPVAGGVNYQAVLTGGTVAGKSVVGYVVGHFTMRNRVLGTNAILSTTINTAAITSAKFASAAITSTVINTNAIGANELADGAITSAKFASGAITSTVLSTTAAAEIHSVINAGTIGTSIAAILVDTGTTLDDKIDTIDTNVDSILDDTGTSGVAVATGAITTTTFGAGAINAAAIAADAIGSSELAATAAQEIADAFLDRDMSTGTDSGSTTVRTPRQALRALRNKVSISGSTLTVTKEDDATASWTAAVTTAAGNPLTSVDPEGP